MVGVRKPDPRIFKHALDFASASANNSVMIGDDLEADVMGAINAGIKGVFFNPKESEHNGRIDKEVFCLSELKLIL